jgi:hypothetical protein
MTNASAQSRGKHPKAAAKGLSGGALTCLPPPDRIDFTPQSSLRQSWMPTHPTTPQNLQRCSISFETSLKTTQAWNLLLPTLATTALRTTPRYPPILRTTPVSEPKSFVVSDRALLINLDHVAFWYIAVTRIQVSIFQRRRCIPKRGLLRSLDRSGGRR